MPKSSKEKQELARLLLNEGISYDQIQDELKNKYGSGMSNTTLKRLTVKPERIAELEDKVNELTLDLKMYKKMYYELLDVVKEKINQ